jgi:hypothetical protein
MLFNYSIFNTTGLSMSFVFPVIPTTKQKNFLLSRTGNFVVYSNNGGGIIYTGASWDDMIVDIQDHFSEIITRERLKKLEAI